MSTHLEYPFSVFYDAVETVRGETVDEDAEKIIASDRVEALRLDFLLVETDVSISVG